MRIVPPSGTRWSRSREPLRNSRGNPRKDKPKAQIAMTREIATGEIVRYDKRKKRLQNERSNKSYISRDEYATRTKVAVAKQKCFLGMVHEIISLMAPLRNLHYTSVSDSIRIRQSSLFYQASTSLA